MELRRHALRAVLQLLHLEAHHRLRLLLHGRVHHAVREKNQLGLISWCRISVMGWQNVHNQIHIGLQCRLYHPYQIISIIYFVHIDIIHITVFIQMIATTSQRSSDTCMQSVTVTGSLVISVIYIIHIRSISDLYQIHIRSISYHIISYISIISAS